MYQPLKSLPDYVSIHALVKSATLPGDTDESVDRVSIHALVKSATCLDAERQSNHQGFNPRAREERDETTALMVSWGLKFQSTRS